MITWLKALDRVLKGEATRPAALREGTIDLRRATFYSFVAIQMAWVLRPFVGQPHSAVSFFRPEAWGNAYVELARIALRAIGN